MDYRIAILKYESTCRFCGAVVYGPNEYGAWVSEDKDGQPLAWCEVRQDKHRPRLKQKFSTTF